MPAPLIMSLAKTERVEQGKRKDEEKKKKCHSLVTMSVPVLASIGPQIAM